MLLTVDVGNTHTVIGGYQGETLAFMWRVVTNKRQTEDEIRAVLTSMFFAGGLKAEDVTGVSLASVVPQLSTAWRRASLDLFGQEAFICCAESTEGLFKTDYPNPHEVGADRVADAIAAVARYGAPCVVVDFGTATNIEVIDKEGSFVGGIIAPGIDTSAQALFSYASKLAATELVDPGAAIGVSTETAIQSGIVYGEAARIDGLVQRIFDQLGYEAPVVATGGLASVVVPCCSRVSIIDSELTLEGLRLAFEAR